MGIIDELHIFKLHQLKLNDVIIDVGNHEREDKLHFCEKCEPHKQEWCLDELAKMTQEFEFKNDYDRLDDN